MIHWWWIPICLFVGALFGLLIAAVIYMAGSDDE